MPLPIPNADESRDDFISRCMSNDTVQEDFDDNDQRMAVCNRQWEEHKMYDLGYTLQDKDPSEHKNIWFDEFEIGTKSKEMPSGDEVEIATFNGVANVMEHEDLGGDVVHKGAFKKTLEEKNGKVYFVTDHTYKVKNYGGIAALRENDNKLEAKVEVLLSNNPEGKEFHTKAQHAASHGLPFGLSIGYDIPEGKMEMKDGTRHIYEVKLWEVSGVLFPMNELSRAVGFKDFHKYSRTDLVNAKTIIESLLDGEPSDDTHTEEADLLKQMTDKLKQLNKS